MPKPRPLWPLLTAALIGLPVLYDASFGPSCWITNRLGSTTGAGIVSRVFDPAIRLGSHSESVLQFAGWYSEVGAAVGWKWQVHQWHQLDGTESCFGVHE